MPLIVARREDVVCTLCHPAAAGSLRMEDRVGRRLLVKSFLLSPSAEIGTTDSVSTFSGESGARLPPEGLADNVEIG